MRADMRRLGIPIALALIAWALPSCGGSASGVNPRMRAAPGASIRYHTVLRTLPPGRPGRTISAQSAVAVRDADAPDRYDVSVTWGPVHVSGEGGNLVQVDGTATARFVRDERRQIEGEPRVEGDIEAAADLARTASEEIVLPEAGLAIGDTWPLSPVTRTIAEGAAVTIPRTARLAEIADGLAHIEVTGHTEGGTLELHGVSVGVAATLEQSFRLRVADAILVEMRSASDVVTTTPAGRAVHREEAHVERVFGAPPPPERHAYRPGNQPSTCDQRLRAMRQRFERTPRGLDLDPWAIIDVEVPIRPTGEPIEEGGPILVGTDRESILGSLAMADVLHTVNVYVVAPDSVSDEELREWLGESIGAGIDIRRIVQGQVHPPSPEPSAEVVALERQMHQLHSIEPWQNEVRNLTALCDAAVEAYTVAEDADPAERAATLRQGLSSAYERCGCETTDLARLERTLDLRLGGPELGWESIR